MPDSSFVALDFETANAHRSSACSIGMAKFENNDLVDTFYSLIKPPIAHGEFHPINVSIHGIRANDVAEAPTFREVWELASNFIGENTVVAHNASFDMSVLRYAMSEYGMDWPDLHYLCTMVIGRATISLPTYQLSHLAYGLGVEWDESAHHDALYDAIKCGEVFSKLLNTSQADDVDDFLRINQIGWGVQHSQGWQACTNWSGNGFFYTPKAKLSEITVNVSANHEHPFYGKHIVFTGTLYSMSRSDAWKLVADIGAIPGDGVNRETDFLVFGQQDILKLRAGDSKSSKYQKAEQMKAKGMPIEILTENDFLTMIDPQSGTRL